MLFRKNIRHTILLLTILLLAGSYNVYSQLSAIHDFSRAENVLVVNESNDTLQFPFAGGMNSCQFANMDFNSDGIEDLLVFDRHGNRILPFLVSATLPFSFKFSPEFALQWPPIEQWIQAIDYNADGKKDIFTYTTGGIKVYRNDSDPKLKFTQVTHPFLLSQQGSTLTNILVTSVDYPAISDVDNDGDMDVLSFWGLGSFVEWHRNTSMERFGNADSLTFEKASSCWGHFAEGNEDNTIILDTCSSYGAALHGNDNLSEDPKHTGSTLLLHDLNADGLPDLTIGDVDFSTLVHLSNGGTLSDALITSQTTDFPNSDNPVNLNTFPAAMLADINNDGKKDLLVSPFDPSLIKGENFNSVSLYLNQGSNLQPDYNFVSGSFLQDQMLDFGSGAYPVIFDYNNDGLMDILAGNYGYSDTCINTSATGLQCSFSSRVALMLNTGTSDKPAFKLVDRNIAFLDTLMMQSLIPALADMDGDGDADLVCGNSKGKLVYCENVALPGQAAEFRLVDPAWHGIDVGDFSAPYLLDVDQDGLTDLICGKRNGTLSYYRNTGSADEAQFALVSDFFGGVDVTNTQLSNYGYSTPCFYKDKYGETILFTGSEFGEIFVFDQINGNLDGSFRFLGILPGISEGWRSGVAIGNLNGDTLTDLLLGNYSGGMGLFYGKPDKIFGIQQPSEGTDSRLKVTPNPAASVVEVTYSGSENKAMYLSIRGIDGKMVREYKNISFPFNFEVSELTNGVYFITVLTTRGILSAKLIVCR